QEQAGYIINQLRHLQFSARVIRCIDPVHHSEERVGGDGEIDLRCSCLFLLNLFENLARELGVFVFLGGNVRVEIPCEALGFVQQHFHLGHVDMKERKVILNEDAQLTQRIADPLKTLLEAFEHSSEAIVLNKKQKFVFGFAVVVE